MPFFRERKKKEPKQTLCVGAEIVAVRKKRKIAAVFAFLALILLTVCCAIPRTPFRLAQDYTVKFYVPGKVQNDRYHVISCGEDSIVLTDKSAAVRTYAELSNVSGISLTLSGGKLDAYRLMQKYAVRTVKTERVQGILCIYGYSPGLESPVEIVGGEKVNIQIAYRNGQITVGFPLILTDY